MYFILASILLKIVFELFGPSLTRLPNAHIRTNRTTIILPGVELATVEIFRSQVAQFLVLDYMKTDAYLARYLKVCKADVSCATEMIKHSYNWRNDNNINQLYEENLSASERYLPYEIKGITKNGDPIVEVYLGKWDLVKAVVGGKQNLVLRVLYQLLERLEYKLYEYSLNNPKATGIRQVYGITDASGYSLRQQGCFGCVGILTEYVKMQGLHYPFMFRNITITNTPRVFGPLLSIIKAVGPADTVGAIQEYGTRKEQWQPVILREVDPEQISKVFGGTME